MDQIVYGQERRATTEAHEQHFQRGETSFELATPVFGGQLQFREIDAGGAAAAWRARLDAGLSAESRHEWTPVRSGQALKLQQQLGQGHVAAQALLSNSKTAGVQGARWDVEFAQEIGLATLLDGMRRYGEIFGPMHWEPAPLLVDLVKRGETKVPS